MRKKIRQKYTGETIGTGLIWLLTISLLCIIFMKNKIN